MNAIVAVIFSEMKDLVARVIKKALSKYLSESIEPKAAKQKKVTLTVEIDKNVESIKMEITHIDSENSFFIGIQKKNDKDEPELFISVNNLEMIMNCKYLVATPLCSGGEQCDEDGEVRYLANEEINKDYFSETTTEDRKDEIIEQILTEVAEAINNQCSSGE